MALLGALAFNAIKGSGAKNQQVLLGLMEPETDDERQELERNSELVLRALLTRPRRMARSIKMKSTAWSAR